MLTVRIGDREQTYTLVETTAPREYDYRGTIEVSRFDANRFVLVPVLQLTAQVPRYLSGLYVGTPSDLYTEPALQDALWSKLAKGDES